MASPQIKYFLSTIPILEFFFLLVENLFFFLNPSNTFNNIFKNSVRTHFKLN